MSLLSLEGVGKRYRGGVREQVALRDVSLVLDRGEYAVIWGLRRSGRSTLLRVAAGIEPPDEGTVRFDGRDLAGRRDQMLGDGIGYCQKTVRSGEGHTILDEVMLGLLARGIPPGQAHSRARASLERVGAEHCATLSLEELDTAEAVRVSLARVLALSPRLLVIDEPTKGVDLLDRDGLLLLLRGLADEGLTVLASTGESTALSGADRTLALDDGELRGSLRPKLAAVVPLRVAG
jgi:energy-coupling factor transporter ATP-binding protein EcfA2